MTPGRVLAAAVAGCALLAVTAPAQPLPAGAARSVVQRPPGPADGPPAFQQDMHWLDGTGESWAMRDAGGGHAVWLHQDPAARVLDEIGGARPVAAYGTRRLSAAYSGPALNLVRATDGAAADIGFLPGDQLDEPALKSFCARTECRVARWYDQSGNRNDAVQPAASARPVVRAAHRVGNSLSVAWDFQATSGEAPRALALPPTLQVDGASLGVLWTGRFNSAAQISPLLELGTDGDPFNFGFWDAHGDFYLGTPSRLAEVAGHAPLSASIGLISVSPQEAVVNFRNRQVGPGPVKPGVHSGGLVGQTAAFKQSAMMELSSLVIYDRPLTQGERFFGLQALGETFAIPQQQQDTYVADGDSITQGIASPYGQSYPWHMERLLPGSLVLFNAGWAGKTLGGPDGLLERYGRFTSKLFNPHARNNLLSVLAGTNDIQAGADAQQVYRAVKSYAAAARQTGFKVVVATVLPRGTFTPPMEAARVSANAMIRANWPEFADSLADAAADPTFAGPGVVANASIYAQDGIHLADYGYQVLARVMADAVGKLLRQGS